MSEKFPSVLFDFHVVALPKGKKIQDYVFERASSIPARRISADHSRTFGKGSSESCLRQILRSKNNPYIDWVVAAYFYAALHLVDALLWEKDQINPESHEIRKEYVRT